MHSASNEGAPFDKMDPSIGITMVIINSAIPQLIDTGTPMDVVHDRHDTPIIHRDKVQDDILNLVV